MSLDVSGVEPCRLTLETQDHLVVPLVSAIVMMASHCASLFVGVALVQVGLCQACSFYFVAIAAMFFAHAC